MASWLSSKLQAAEQLLNQIDQQAAGSLGRQDRGPQDPFFRAPIQSDAPNSKIFGDPLVPGEESSSTSFVDRSLGTAAPRDLFSSSSVREKASHRPEEDDWTEIPSTTGSSGDWKRPLTSKGKIQRAERRPTRKNHVVAAKRISATKRLVKEEESSKSLTKDVEKNEQGEESKRKKVEEKVVEHDPVPPDSNIIQEERDGDELSGRKQIEEELLACKAEIDDRAAFVERLEVEKQALEALVAEREEQQSKEAAELRASMVELLQAADLEKQRHSHTRMDALARETQLQNESVDLAKTLAAAQRKLDAEVRALLDARTKLEMKRMTVFELERKASRLRSTLANPASPPKYNKADEEKQKIMDDIDYYKAQVDNLQAEIHTTKISQQMQSEKEKELESRLATLTDHLIHKQSQVEAYSTEKATLLFRLEAYTSQERALKARKNESTDLEFGPAESGDEIISWRDISSKLDSFFLQGTRVLGMNRTARSLAAAYFFLLHVWVAFIVVQHARFLHR